ncbi:MAG: hypothetical protein US28_C0029G0002 [Candidatus Daviesbacteria bacterium GW2011_GWA1_36_8]|uniref:Lipid II isoglutaminyl synthase (glutamine-hydrolyzing) subunit MurT n=1 Tax=Candidatus Daviesbacteria bacterium GW2011_GWA1_36_8 TaxID=1618417 RepID=A0A0G0FA28_9BACT|nr:MAG: hypothetical protein US28_C0029G0002 [Candidatus Daviesbacteria bacterium GW2011_GWA1_36_8]
MLRLFIAIVVGKTILFLTRFLKVGGGSAAPGLYGLKICPDLVSILAKQIPINVIITGTNGKTTTSRMLAHFAKSNNLKVLRNSTGSNLERGIASALISSFLILSGKLEKFDLAIWEMDEAAFNSVVNKINPSVIVFLNLFRDQLDRYGEVNTVLKKWTGTLKLLNPDSLIILNGDDFNIATLKDDFKGKTVLFGLDEFKVTGENRKGKAQKLDYEAENIKTEGLEGCSFQITMNHELLTINLPLPGIYHIYDFLAAFISAYHLNLDINISIESLKDFSPAFGRVEKFEMTHPVWKAKKEGYIFLIKNPAGAGHVFATLKEHIKKEDTLLLALNDNFADGKDVSWIWDANFEEFRVQNSECRVICSGTRAYDLAVRLKYSGVEARNIEVIPSLDKAFQDSKRGLNGRLYILPTYTAMLQLQDILVKSKVKKEYWREE